MKNKNIIHVNQELNNEKNKVQIESNFVKPSNAFYHIFDKISKTISKQNKINLTGLKSESMYTKSIITEDLLEFIKLLISNIIKKVAKLDMNIDYYIKDIIDVYQQVDTHGNQRYIVKCFIYDIKNFNQIKILLDFLIISDDMYINYIGNDLASNLNIINKYDYRIFNSGYLKNTNNIQDNIRATIDSYYKKYYNIIGYDKSPIEYSHYISKLDTVYKYNIKDLVKNYVPPNIPNLYDTRFGEKHENNWDETGINIIKDENVLINNNSGTLQPNLPLDSPGSGPKQSQYNGIYNIQQVGFNSGGNVVTNSYYY